MDRDTANPILDRFLSEFLEDLSEGKIPDRVHLPRREVVVQGGEIDDEAVLRLEQARRYSVFVYGSAFLSWVGHTEDDRLEKNDLAVIVEDPTKVVVERGDGE